MKVLLLWPPTVPMYFNASHHLPLWEVAAYLRRLDCVSQVKALDAGVLNCTWNEVTRLLSDKPDVVGVLNEFETVSGVGLLLYYCRSLSPRSKLVTFGRASSVIPRFFQRYGPDAIVASGDWEAGVAQFVEVCAGERKPEEARGLLLQGNGGYRDSGPGDLLPPENWADPDPAEVPWDLYNGIYAMRHLKSSGLADKRELSVTVARGCPLSCSFCIIHGYQGKAERRRSVDAVIGYMDEAKRSYDFDYATMFAPTFTLRRDWVLQFAAALRAHPTGYLWKTCTMLSHLDRELIQEMAASGCLRISVGLETLDPGALELLPRQKRATEERLRQVARWCGDAGIELNCLVMLGMPGQTPEGVEHTYRVVREIGALWRPMMFTRYDNLSPDMPEHSLTMHCRQVIDGTVDGAARDRYYQLHLGPTIGGAGATPPTGLCREKARFGTTPPTGQGGRMT